MDPNKGSHSGCAIFIAPPFSTYYRKVMDQIEPLLQIEFLLSSYCSEEHSVLMY